MILVDTSVWVDHFRRGNAQLSALLHDGLALGHPFVVGELACGNPRNRQELLGLLGALPQVSSASAEVVLNFIEHEKLFGRGIGWVDAHLLASARTTGCLLWSLDRALVDAAASLRLAAR